MDNAVDHKFPFEFKNFHTEYNFQVTFYVIVFPLLAKYCLRAVSSLWHLYESTAYLFIIFLTSKQKDGNIVAACTSLGVILFSVKSMAKFQLIFFFF